jgi:transcriptional regulator with PAS, ATPase and Fis domain
MEKYVDWANLFPGAVTFCDKEGIIIYMNSAAQEIFNDDGGAALIGTSLLDCHPEPSRSQIVDMLDNQLNNTYTIEKKEIKKIIHQAPWFDSEGDFGGLVEISFEIPMEMDHIIRK